MSKLIFTFWEPKNKMPAYIELCLETWRKFLPEYEIVILDYSNIEKYLGKHFYSSVLYNFFSLPKQADAIRAAILEKYGGIWLDADTIITSNEFNKLLETNSEFILIDKHIAFISAKRNAYILKKWVYNIKFRLLLYKHIARNYYKKTKKFIPFFEKWDYLGNGIINRYLKKRYKRFYHSISSNQKNILLEKTWKEKNNIDISKRDAYEAFYFSNNVEINLDEVNSGLVLLHNSWTPEKYKNMGKEEFLKQDITLAKLLKTLLEDKK